MVRLGSTILALAAVFAGLVVAPADGSPMPADASVGMIEANKR